MFGEKTKELEWERDCLKIAISRFIRVAKIRESNSGTLYSYMTTDADVFSLYVGDLEKAADESLAMAELTSKVEKILIDKGLLPRPKEKK